MLVSTFLSQAISPAFPNNLYHNSLYRWHVLKERNIPNPGRPPYYSMTFFSLIKHVKETTPLNVSWISVKQWYQLLMEMGITHTNDDLNSPPVIINSKLEDKHLGKDLSMCYQSSRIFGLSTEQKFFNLKMMQ